MKKILLAVLTTLSIIGASANAVSAAEVTTTTTTVTPNANYDPGTQPGG
jgi:uncharacterized protein YraI